MVMARSLGGELAQLWLLLWSRSDFEVTEQEALALYEATAQRVHPEAMGEVERRFFDDLVERYGQGVFLG